MSTRRPGSTYSNTLLNADGTVVAEEVLPLMFPPVIAPDGAFLTVGYGRPFSVCEDYVPPAPAPASLLGIRVDTGPPPPFDFDAEYERAMRHQ